MSKKKKIGFIAFFAVLIILVIVAVFQNVSSKETDKTSYETVLVEKQEPLLADGKVMPVETGEYTYDPQNGEIASIAVEDRQTVESGDELFRYKNQAIEDQIADLRTNKKRLNSTIEKNTKDLNELKKAEDEIPEPLDPNGLPAGSEMAPSNQGTIETMESAITDLKNQIDDLDTQISRLQKQETTIVKSDVDGMVLLDESLKNNAASPFLRIITEDTLIQSSISEYDYYALSEELEVDVYINAEDRELKGVITSVDDTAQSYGGMDMGADSLAGGSSGAVDMSNFEFLVRPEDKIQYDFTVQIRIPLEGIVIPESAILEEDNQEYVYAVKDGKAQKQVIQREKRGLQNVVASGLSLKDIVITNPDELLEEGMEISTREEGESPSQ